MASVRRWFLRITYTFLVFVLLVALSGFTYEQIGRAKDASRQPPRIGQAIDIGGRTLNLDCSGRHAPDINIDDIRRRIEMQIPYMLK